MRRMPLLLATLCTVAAFSGPGCSSSTSTPNQAASEPPERVQGEYVSHSSGSIASIVFVDATNYWMVVTSPCETGETDCIQRGTYALSATFDRIAFTDGSTGTVTTLPFKAQTTSHAQLASLHTLGGVSLGGNGSDAGADADAGDAGSNTTDSGGVSLVSPDAGGIALVSPDAGNLVPTTLVSLVSAFTLGPQAFTQETSTAGGSPSGGAGTSPLTIGNITGRAVTAVSDVPNTPPAAGAYRVHNIDLGTGLGVLIQGNDFTMLWDGGSNDDEKQMSATSNGNRLLAYLAAALGPSGPATCTPDGDTRQKISRPKIHIDHVFLSHPHNDHVSMLSDVLSCYSVSNVWDAGDPYPSDAYAKFLANIGPAGVATYHTAASVAASETVSVDNHSITIPSSVKWVTFAENDTVTLGAGALFKVLHADGGKFPNDANLNSSVLRLTLGTNTMLVTGDEEAGGTRAVPATSPTGTEALLLTNHRAELKVDIFQVAHHGSETSSRMEFLQAVAPQWALIGSGPFPYSGVVLPDAPVIAALQSLGPTILNTDVHDKAGCPVKDRIGLDDTAPGGCDNYVLDIVPPGSSAR